MEKYIKYSIFAILTILIISACEKGDLKFPEPINGALVYLHKDAATGTAIDFNNLSTVNLDFDVSVRYGDVSSVDIICVKTSMNSPCPDGDTDSCAWANKVVYVSGMTTGVVNITPQKLIDAFSDYTSEADFTLGDEFFFYPVVYTADGLTLPLYSWEAERGVRQNFDADIAQEPNASLSANYVVDCPFDRDIFPGTYDNPTGGYDNTTVELDPDVPNGIIIREFWWGDGIESLHLVIHDDGTITGEDQLVADVDAFGFGPVWAREITGGLVTNNCTPVFQFSASMDLPEGGMTWGVQTFVLTRTGDKTYTISTASTRNIPTQCLD